LSSADMKKSTVAVKISSPSTVLADVQWVMESAGLGHCLARDKAVILKDNLSWHMPFLSANTTPWQLEGVILALRDAGYGEITAVENNTVVTDPFKGARLNKYRGVYEKYGIPVRYNFRPSDMSWVPYEPKTPLRALHKIFPDGIVLPDFFFDKNILHLPTMKCHIYTTMTGAMKNAFGGLIGIKRHYCHAFIHEVLVDLLAIQKEIHPGIFTVMDGTICGNGPGPRTMKPVVKNYLLASGDSVAVDAVSAKMMGFDPMGIPFIRMAHEAGLGTGRVEEIDIVGEDISDVNFGFEVSKNLVKRVGGSVWFGPLRFLEHLFFRTPLVYVFVFASYLYHDYLWWPTVGKMRMRQIARTPWGRLFAEYGESHPGANTPGDEA